MRGLLHSVKSFSIPRNKLLVNVDYTTLGNHFAIASIQIYSIHQLEKLQKKYQISERRHSMWIISISQNYEVNGMSVKSFGCPNFLFNMIFISSLHNMEAMKRITIMTVIREMLIVLICLQIYLISKRYSRRLSRK